jgi:phosphoribosyl 1,2-cyclic phosphate phosphodiesterase
MKITFLGTAAAEGIPSPFCMCSTCRHARIHPDRNLRRRSSILINNDLLIDAGPDLFSACAHLGLSLNELKYLAVTHSHFDHFYPHNFEIRSRRYVKDETLPELLLVAGPSALQLLDQIGIQDQDLKLKRIPFLPLKEVVLPPYTIKSIAASHAPQLGDAMNYIISDGVIKVLYAVDTGIFHETVWSTLENTQFQIIIIESTNGHKKTSKNHLNFEGLEFMLKRLQDIGSLTSTSRVYATHFSHLANPPHETLEQSLATLNITCAYDGLVLELKPENTFVSGL